MAQTIKTTARFSGLQTYPNPLSEVTPGALQLASNVNVSRMGVVSARRGQRVYSSNTNTSSLPYALIPTPTQLYVVDNSSGAAAPTQTYPGNVYRIESGQWSVAAIQAWQTGVGVNTLSIVPPPGNSIRYFQANGFTYFSSYDGQWKLLPLPNGNAKAGYALPIGVPPALDIQATLSASSTGFLQGGYATSYQVVFGTTDVNGSVALGAPSNTVIVSNPQQATAQTQFVTNSYGVNPAWAAEITLPFNAAATKAFSNVYACQAGTSALATLRVGNASNTATFELTQTCTYFGPVGTALSIVIPVTIASVSTTALTVSGIDPTFLNAATAATGAVIYQSFNSSNPSSSASSSVQSTITSTTSSVINVAAGTWAAGAAAVVIPVTVSTPQGNAVLINHNSAAVVQGNDVLQLPGVVAPLTVTNITPNVDGSSAVDKLGLTAYPTGLLLVQNSAITVLRPSNVSVTFTVPPEISAFLPVNSGQATTAFYQVYRSYTQAQIIAGTLTQPTATMQLVQQGSIPYSGAQNTTNSTITFTDISPDATLGATLYTSPSQQGATAAQYQPPVASDVAYYQNTAFYANCQLPASYSTQLLAVSTTANSSASLQPGDYVTITVNGGASKFIATATNPPPAGQFLIDNSPSVTTAINNTVANLCHVINQAGLLPSYTNTSNGGLSAMVMAVPTFGPAGMGGTFTVRTSRGVGSFQLSWTANSGVVHSSPFSQLPTGSVLPAVQQNALYFSQPNQPEAVPLVNYLQVGLANYPIQRIIPLADSLIIFKPEGIYRLSGTTAAQFSAQLLNNTAQLLANETAVQLQSAVLAFTSQGLISISQGGVQILSQAINDDLMALAQLPAFASTAFAVGHEAERRYILWTPALATDTSPTIAYVYNTITNAWTTWNLARTCGLANEADLLLYTGANTSTTYNEGVIYQEAAIGAAHNTGDETVSGTVTFATNGLSATLTGLPANTGTNVANGFGAGSALVTASGTAYVTGVTSLSSTSVTLNFAAPVYLPNGAATLYQAVTCQIAPVPIAGDDPGAVKQFQEFALSLVGSDCPNITATCATDFDEDQTVLPLNLNLHTDGINIGWGSGQYGEQPYGGGLVMNESATQAARQLVPIGATRGHVFWPTITANVAAGNFKVTGLTLQWSAQSTIRTR